jgi:phosphoribosyl-ATP pyrophosphohydrolase
MSKMDTATVLARLESIIADRSDAGNANKSYTATLLAGGREKCARKFGEEAIELVLASVSGDRDHVTAEAADVLFHMLVVLRASNVSLEAVINELAGRFQQSGLQEKASRTAG